MTDILLCSLITSLFCLGFKISTGEDMLLNWVKVALDRIFIYKDFKQYYSGSDSYYDLNQGQREEKEITAHKLYYPILYCIKCMPSIYGTAIAFLLFPFTLHLLYQIPLVIFCSVTLNCIFYQMYE